MHTTTHDLFTFLHGTLFGGFFLMAFFAVAWECWRRAHEIRCAEITPNGRRIEASLLILMAVFGWLAVLSGTLLIYPWYRAAPPPGTLNLVDFPRSFLLAHSDLAPLHSLGMEWKEHIGWIAPILATMCAWVLIRHRNITQSQPRLRRAVIVFAFAGVFATAIAGVTGQLLDKSAPVFGGSRITIGAQR